MDGLLSIRDWVRPLTDTANHLPSDVSDRGKDVHIEAASLDQKPEHAVTIQRLDGASAVVGAVEDGVGEDHLGVEDCSLVNEHREGVANAREELPRSISVGDSELFLLLSLIHI